jgi:hypothetical protein
MKVACLLSGQPRFCKSFDAQLQHLKNDDTIDWFVCIWKNNQQPLIKTVIPPALLNTDTASATEYIASRLPTGHRLVSLSAVDELDTAHIIEKNYRRSGWPLPEHIYLMYHGIYMANQLKLQHEAKFGQYDLVVRTRPDLSLDKDFDLPMAKSWLDQHENAIITARNQRHGGANDQFAVGHSKTIDAYADIANNLQAIYDEGVEYAPESLLLRHFQRAQISDMVGDFDVHLREHYHIENNRHIVDLGSWA